MRIVFFGTPIFAATVLDYLLTQGAEVIAVVSRPDRAVGRSNKLQPTPVKQLALKRGLPVYQPEKASTPEFAEFLRSLEADYFVVAAYAEILKPNVLAAPKRGCINVHASLLPKYRGAAPIQRCIMAGEKESGVTIMQMEPEMDAGAAIVVAKTPISETMTAGELTEKLAEIGSKAIWGALQQIESGTAQPIEQDASQATFAPKMKPEEGEILWNRSCEEVHNHIRGVTPKPGAWCWVAVRGDRLRLKILKSEVDSACVGEPKEIVSQHTKELVVACTSGAVRLLEVQLQGKKAMTVIAFLNGVSVKELTF